MTALQASASVIRENIAEITSAVTPIIAKSDKEQYNTDKENRL